MRDVAIVGGGASGLFLASHLQKGDILLIEGNGAPGRKILVSGGGKANITNKSVSDENYLCSDPNFLHPALEQFDNEALLSWVRRSGCEPVLKKGRYYFCPHSAKELLSILSPKRAKMVTGCKVLEVKRGFEIVSTCGTYKAKNVVVASGGVSYKNLGASPIGYEIAKTFGHEVVTPRPALVGFTVQKEQFWFKELSGISLQAKVKLKEKEFFDDILFTHKGVSGPAILNASLYWEKGAITVSFLQKPLRSFLKNPKKQISSQIPLPKRFVKRFLQELQIEDKRVEFLRKDEYERLQAFCNYTFAPAGTFGFARAEVTKGGVAVEGIDPMTMESRYEKGLYFIGEVLDVTGELGGYNFQWAFSSAYLAALALKNGKI